MRETIFSNARLVLADEGSLLVRNGSIAAISRRSKAPKGAIDCAMDCLVPGLVEPHTDHLEAHFRPRPKVFWPAEAAGHLRVEHLLHLRCELACADTAEYAEAFLHNPDLRLISLMDHTPGQRQFIRMDEFREYFGGKSGMSEQDMSAFIAERQDAHTRYAVVNRRLIVEMAQDRHVPLASHDDATVDHVQESADDGVTIAEFPTTMKATDLDDRGEVAIGKRADLVRVQANAGIPVVRSVWRDGARVI